jgi:transposase
MEVILKRCCGLDVHKKTIAACRRILGPNGKLEQEIRTFGTMTADILALADWLREGQVTHVAMESTGVFWKPIWNLLEDEFEILLVNARHIKQLPGRKTDIKDCEWIAQLLQHGLLRASFVPPKPIRAMRDLTRHRAKLASEKTAVVNRIHKTLEDANIKLGSVASDIVGVSGLSMLKAMAAGEEDPVALAEMARRRLRGKIPDLQRALHGRMTEHHRFLLENLLRHLDFLEAQIHSFEQRIEEVCRPFEKAVLLLETIPGVSRTTAHSMIAEIGTDMSVFPTADHLASWAGVCPGNNESAGKHKSGKTPKANRWLRRTLGEAAWAAARTKKTYLSAQYRRLASRRGKKRAIVAVGHTILIIAFHLLRDSTSYSELGADYFDRINPERLKNYFVKRLEQLGHKVVLEKVA